MSKSPVRPPFDGQHRSAGIARAPTSIDVARPLQRVSRVEQGGGQLALAIEPTVLCEIFGVADPSLALRLLSQLLSVIQPDPHKPIDPASIEQLLTLIEGIRPTDTLEAMTATMLVGAQHAALDTLRRASHPEQTPVGRQSYMALSLKAMRTFALLLEALNHGRGKGVTQQIIVTRVSQTVVGSMSTGGGGDAKSARRSHGSRSGCCQHGQTPEETGR
jgi:hypothetical protein